VPISPRSVVNANWQVRRVDVALTKMQVEISPDIDTHLPVSPQLAFARFRFICQQPRQPLRHSPKGPRL
jgi:hypothetical protein